MNKLKLPIALVFVILFNSNKSFSQTTVTISYDATSNLSTSKCNVFDTAINIGGKLHKSVIGAATFSSANGLSLPTNYTNSTGKINRSTYRISYPFKRGNAYRIEVTASGNTSNSVSYPTLGTSLFTSPGLTYTSNSCDAGDITGFPQMGTLFLVQVTSMSILYSPNNANFICPNDFDYLVLEATCQAAQDITSYLNLQKIKIIETQPISFTAAPTPNTIICGSTTPVTFTVNNIYSTPGVTGYTWNLGSATNGWKLANGAAAPQIITTNALTNTLTLTPTCGAVLSSIIATAAIGTSNYNTNISSVSINQPALSISGSDAFCIGSSTYSISNLPCNPNLTWSISPTTGIASLTTSGNSCTLTKTGNGFITLTATLNAACLNNSGKFTKTINVGVPQTNYKLTNIQTLTTLCGWDVNLLNLCNASGFIFQDNTALPYTNETGPPQPYNYLVQQNVDNGPITKTYTIAAVNQCGTGNFVTKSIIVPAPWRTGNCSFGARTVNSSNTQNHDEILIYPNPSSSIIKIIKKDNIGFSSVRILDKSGVIKKRLIFKNNASNCTIDISNLTIGVYQIQILVGNNWTSKIFTKL